MLQACDECADMGMTYSVIVQCANCVVFPRAAELQNVEQWALTNNLKLNRAKTNEIIFVNKGKSTTAATLNRHCASNQ